MREVINIPRLRFPEFEGTWKEKSIQELIDDKYIIEHLDGNHGALYPKSNEFSDEGIPYITATDIVNNKINLNNSKKLPINRALTFKKGISKNGDLLFAHNATVGPVSILETNYDFVILSTTLTYYRLDCEKIIPHYLLNFFQCQHFVGQYSRVMSQSTRNQVPITQQRKFNIYLPKVSEQQKIADFLTAVDKRIELLEKKKTLLETYKKGVMKKIFNQEIRFKDDNGNDFPDWEEMRLGDITNKKSSNISANSIEQIEGDFIVYGATGELKKIDFYEMDRPYISIVKDGSGVGRVNMCKPFSSVLGTLDILTNNELSDLDFVFQFLSKTSFLKYVTGSSIPHIYYKDYSKLKMLVPTVEEQVKISKFLSSIDNQIELLETQIDKSKTWKKGLLQKMFV